MAEKRPLEEAEERLSCSFQALPSSAPSRCRPGAWPKAGSFPRAKGRECWAQPWHQPSEKTLTKQQH